MSHQGEIPDFRRRYRYMVAVVMLTFLVLMGRLCQLQLVRGAYYRQQTQSNFVQERRVRAPRGLIFDRLGRPLVSTRPSYDLYVTTRFVTPESMARLVRELELDPKRERAVRARIRSLDGPHRFHRYVLLRDITRDELARLETHKEQLSGFSVVAEPHRNYVHGKLAAHVLGYMNEVTRRELEADKEGVYELGDLVGRYGVERLYESYLRGVPGRQRVVVDARGRVKRGAVADELIHGPRRRDPTPGNRLVLTIDLALQRLLERALRRFPSGAAVVLEANTGRILASASRPAFDPNLMTGRLSPAQARELLEDPHRPLLDKVYREHYFPGSTYKVVTAAAAVEEGAVEWGEEIECKGWLAFGHRVFRCSHVHGDVDLYRALVESCNVFFYALGERVGMDTLARYARNFGLGASTGLGLNGEVGGFVPTKAWYAQRKRPFRIGYTLNAAIGQGNVKVTPLQIANLYATIANGGRLYLPQVLERLETHDGRTLQSFEPRLRRHVNVQPETLARIRAALADVVADPKGTAYESRLANISVAGKTGTAQVTRRGGNKSYWLNDHSWFGAFAPAENPKIALAVLIEHGGRADKVAVPVAMQIIKGYFELAGIPHAEAPNQISARTVRGQP